MNIRKLKAIADELDAVVLRPYYPVSPLWRIVRDADGMQLDFMDAIDGVRSVEGPRKRNTRTRIGEGGILWQRSLLSSKARRLPGGRRIGQYFRYWRKRLKKQRITRKAKLEALKKDNDLAIREMIRRQLALPMEKRTNFLRKRIGICSSCL